MAPVSPLGLIWEPPAGKCALRPCCCCSCFFYLASYRFHCVTLACLSSSSSSSAVRVRVSTCVCVRRGLRAGSCVVSDGGGCSGRGSREEQGREGRGGRGGRACCFSLKTPTDQRLTSLICFHLRVWRAFVVLGMAPLIASGSATRAATHNKCLATKAWACTSLGPSLANLPAARNDYFFPVSLLSGRPSVLGSPCAPK